MSCRELLRRARVDHCRMLAERCFELRMIQILWLHTFRDFNATSVYAFHDGEVARRNWLIFEDFFHELLLAHLSERPVEKILIAER